MTITGAIVLFAVIWFLGLLVALPLGLTTHGDTGTNSQDEPAFAPTNANVKRKMLWVTLVTVLIWAPVCGVIASGWITIADIDFFNRLER